MQHGWQVQSYPSIHGMHPGWQVQGYPSIHGMHPGWQVQSYPSIHGMHPGWQVQGYPSIHGMHPGWQVQSYPSIHGMHPGWQVQGYPSIHGMHPGWQVQGYPSIHGMHPGWQVQGYPSIHGMHPGWQVQGYPSIHGMHPGWQVQGYPSIHGMHPGWQVQGYPSIHGMHPGWQVQGYPAICNGGYFSETSLHPRIPPARPRDPVIQIKPQAPMARGLIRIQVLVSSQKQGTVPQPRARLNGECWDTVTIGAVGRIWAGNNNVIMCVARQGVCQPQGCGLFVYNTVIYGCVFCLWAIILTVAVRELSTFHGHTPCALSYYSPNILVSTATQLLVKAAIHGQSTVRVTKVCGTQSGSTIHPWLAANRHRVNL